MGRVFSRGVPQKSTTEGHASSRKATVREDSPVEPDTPPAQHASTQQRSPRLGLSSMLSSSSRRSSSTSPTRHDTIPGQKGTYAPWTMVPRQPPRSMDDHLLCAMSSENAVDYMRRASSGDIPAVISHIYDRLADHHEDSSWPFKLRLLHALCLESGYLPQALYVSGVKFDPRRDPVACGTFTDVYRGSLKGQDVAVKRVRIAGGPADREIFTKRLAAETVVWRHVTHPNIVPFFGIIQDQSTPFAILHTVTLWMPQGTLLDFIKSSSYDAHNQRGELLLEVARALKYLHSLSIVHGDLKFTNVLIDAGFHARVMDFGLSTIVGPSFAGESAASGNSARWMGPEFVANLDVDETPGPTAKSDVYSFGRLVYAVSTKREPLQHMRSDVAVVLFLQSGRQPPRPKAEHCDGVPMSDALWQLTLDCWKMIPDERPNMSEVVQLLCDSSCKPSEREATNI